MTVQVARVSKCLNQTSFDDWGWSIFCKTLSYPRLTSAKLRTRRFPQSSATKRDVSPICRSRTLLEIGSFAGGSSTGRVHRYRWLSGRLNGFLGKLEMHAVHRATRKSGAPIPSVLIEERCQLKTPAVGPRSSLRNDVRPEKKVDRGSPTMVRKRIWIVALVSHAQHAGGLDGGYHVRNLLIRIVENLLERDYRYVEAANGKRTHVDARLDASADWSGDRTA
jgi:hypothetical protein